MDHSKLFGRKTILTVTKKELSFKTSRYLKCIFQKEPFCSVDYDEISPMVTIIVKSNDIWLTNFCLQALHKHTIGIKFEILVVDSPSFTYRKKQYLKIKNKFKLISFKKERFYSESYNLAAQQAKGNYLCFLDTAILVKENWLLPAIDIFKNDSSVGIVALNKVNLDGHVLNQAFNFDFGILNNHCVESINHMIDSFENAHFVVSKSVFNKVNGFSLRWDPIFFECVDFAFKVNKMGLNTAVSDQSLAVELVEVSNLLKNKNENYYITNKDIFLKSFKNQGYQNLNFEYYNEPAILKKNKTMGFYTPFDMLPAGGERFFLNIMKSVSSEYNIILFFDELYSYNRVCEVCILLNIKPFFLKIDNIANINIYDLDCYWEMGNKSLPMNPGYGKKNIYICQFPYLMHSYEIQDRKNHLSNYKAIFVYSEYVKKHLINALLLLDNNFNKIYILNPSFGNKKNNEFVSKDFSSLQFISVGRFFRSGHCKNHHIIVNFFINFISKYPFIKAELHIVGSLINNDDSIDYYNEVKKAATGYPIFLYPNADEKTLDDLYRQSNIYIHAAGYGLDESAHPEKMEHFGITVVEAMSYGLIPIVYHAGGPSEIINKSMVGFTYKDQDQWDQICLSVVNNKDNFLSLNLKAIEKSKNYSDDQFDEHLNALLKEIN